MAILTKTASAKALADDRLCTCINDPRYDTHPLWIMVKAADETAGGKSRYYKLALDVAEINQLRNACERAVYCEDVNGPKRPMVKN